MTTVDEGTVNQTIRVTFPDLGDKFGAALLKPIEEWTQEDRDVILLHLCNITAKVALWQDDLSKLVAGLLEGAKGNPMFAMMMEGLG